MTVLKPGLVKRIISAGILIPVVCALIYYGSWPLGAVIAIFGILSIYEWVKIALNTRFPLLLSFTGFLYIFIAFWCCYWLRHYHPVGLAYLFVFAVWASDTGAYALGKLVGGPKMLVEVSPNKTWSGLAGAMLGPFAVALVYFLVMAYLQKISFAPHLVFSAVGLGIIFGSIGQLGDLMMSSLKRLGGVKDSGVLIPGHGGVLDRVDAMMLTGPVFLFIVSRFSNVFGL